MEVEVIHLTPPEPHRDPSPNTFICRFCDDILESKESLKDHENAEHLDILPETDLGSSVPVSGLLKNAPEKRPRSNSEEADLPDELLDLDSDSPPNKKRRGSNSSAVTIECDEDEPMNISEESLIIENVNNNNPIPNNEDSPVNPTEALRLKVVSQIDEIRDLIQKMLGKGTETESEKDSININIIKNAKNLEAERAKPFVQVQDLPDDIEIIHLSETGTRFTEIVETIVPQSVPQSIRETAEEVEIQRVELGEDFEAMEESGLVIVEAEGELESEETVQDVNKEPVKGSTNGTNALAEVEKVITSLLKEPAGGTSPSKNQIRLIYENPETERRETQNENENAIENEKEIQKKFYTCSQCLTRFTSEKDLEDHSESCLFKNIDFEKIISNFPAGPLLDESEFNIEAHEINEANPETVQESELEITIVDLEPQIDSASVTLTDAELRNDAELRIDAAAPNNSINQNETPGILYEEDTDKDLEIRIVQTESLNREFLNGSKECETVNAPVLFKCQVCNASLASLKEFQKHLGTHMSEKWICTVCSRVCKSKGGLKNHFTRTHSLEEQFLDPLPESLKSNSNNNNPNPPRPGSNASSTSTEIIDEETMDLDTINSINIGSNEDFRCELCPKVFTCSSKYFGHLRAFHRMNVIGSVVNVKDVVSGGKSQEISNEINEGVGGTEMNITNNTGIINACDTFVCDQCGANFHLEALLNHHLQTFHGYTVLD